MLIHVNPETGATGKCRAQKKECPFGAEAHFDNQADAHQYAEQIMEAQYSATATVQKTELSYEEQIANFTPEERQRVIDNSWYITENVERFSVSSILAIDRDYLDSRVGAAYLSYIERHDPADFDLLISVENANEELFETEPEEWYQPVRDHLMQRIVRLANLDNPEKAVDFELPPEPEGEGEVQEVYTDSARRRHMEDVMENPLSRVEMYELIGHEDSLLFAALRENHIETRHVVSVHHEPYKYIDVMLDYQRTNLHGKVPAGQPIERRRIRLSPDDTAHIEYLLREGILTTDHLRGSSALSPFRSDSPELSDHVIDDYTRGALNHKHQINNEWGERQKRVHDDLSRLVANYPDVLGSRDTGVQYSARLYFVDEKGQHTRVEGEYPALEQHLYHHPGASN